MAVRVAINGFGRIGRLVLRATHETRCEEVEIVAINDLGPVATNAHLLKYDSAHGRLPGEITTGSNWMDIGRGKIAVSAERDPAQLPCAVSASTWCSNVPGFSPNGRPRQSMSRPVRNG